MADAHPARVLDTRGLLEVLERHGVEYVVVGGVAVQAHGHFRSTADLDVIPSPGLANVSRLAEALAELEAEGFGTSRPVDVSDPQLLRRAPMIPLMTRHGRLDLLAIGVTDGTPRTYDELRRRALEVELGDVTVAIAGTDDLIRMKRATGRDRDLDDIAALSRTREELEREAEGEGPAAT
ncbi:MAG: DUF6036 family nucleotidyltransferase [Thermoleophilaceae bacterium]